MYKFKHQLLRFIVQFSFLAYLIYAGFAHQAAGGGPDGSASVDALCPFGGVETFYKFITTGQFISKIQASSLILLVALLLLILFSSRAFCSWICPFGTIQEWLGKLGKKIMGKNLIVPERIDKPLRLLKYLLLLAIIILTWSSATLVFRNYDPWVAFMHISSGFELFNELAIPTFILIAVLLLSFLFDRFWCKYLCPLGAFINLFSRISLFKVFRNKSLCTKCGICNRNCQMNVNIKESEAINDLECISCLKCSSVCPVNNTIKIKNAWFKSPKFISSTTFIIITLSIFFGVYFVSQATNTWIPTGQLPVIKSGAAIDFDSIKGYMTLSEIASYLNIEQEELYSILELPDNLPKETKLKDVSKLVEGFSSDSAREKLKIQLE